MTRPVHIAAIGHEIAIAWDDGTESFIAMDRLRAHSPSAENVGERDLLGVQYGGSGHKDFSGVTVRGWNMVGGYAVQFEFSDGHNTGIFAYDYLRGLG